MGRTGKARGQKSGAEMPMGILRPRLALRAFTYICACACAVAFAFPCGYACASASERAFAHGKEGASVGVIGGADDPAFSFATSSSSDGEAEDGEDGTGQASESGGDGTGEASEGGGMGMSVVCGFDGTVRYGRDMRIRAEITNDGGDFAGTLRVLLPSEWGENVLYGRDVAIPAKETKTIDVIVPARFSGNRILVSLTDEEGRERASAVATLTVQEGSGVLYFGILSDSYGDLGYFASEGNESRKSFLLDAETFPTDKRALDMLDVILVNDFNTSLLNGAQYEALKGFVRDGGTLVLGGGGTADKTMAAFTDDFLTGSIGPVLGEKIWILANGGEVSKDARVISLDGGIAVSLGDSGSLMEKASVGRGVVQAIAFDLALDGSDWDTVGAAVAGWVADNVSQERARQIYSGEDGYYSYQLTQGLRVADAGSVPDVRKYAAVLAAYLLLAGPVLYLILKRLDRRNYAWALVPALAVLFSAIIYGIGSGTRVSGPYAQYMTISTVKDGVEEKQLEFCVTAPYNRPYELSLSGDQDVSVRDDANTYYVSDTAGGAGSLSAEDYDLAVTHHADRTAIEVRDHAAFESAYFQIRSQEETGAHVESDLCIREDFSYEGTVTEYLGCDLSDAFLMVDGCAYVLGEMKEGEPADISGKESYVLQRGSQFTVQNNEDFPSIVTGSNGNALLRQEGNEADARRRYFALAHAFLKGDFSQEDCLVGFTKEDSPVMQDLGIRTIGKTKMVMAPLEVGDTADGKRYLADLEDQYTVISGEYDLYGHMMGTVDVTVSFGEGEEPVSLVYGEARNEEFMSSAEFSSAGFQGVVSVYDYDLSQYVDLFVGGTKGEVDSLGPYLRGNEMRLRFTPDEETLKEYGAVTIPVLSAVTREDAAVTREEAAVTREEAAVDEHAGD